MRCEAIDCLHNANGYCADDSYVTIDHAGECTQFEYAISIVTLCTSMCPKDPSLTDGGKYFLCPIDHIKRRFGTECPHLGNRGR